MIIKSRPSPIPAPSTAAGVPAMQRLWCLTVAPSVLRRAKARRPRVEKQRDGQDEIPEHALIIRAQERCQVSNRAKIGVDGAAFTLDGGLLNLQVSEGLRLDRELVGKAVALGLSSLVVRGAEL
jgi:hypothetical protein